jgi:hypothetical protein
MKIIVPITGAILALGLAPRAQATTITVNNPSFENFNGVPYDPSAAANQYPNTSVGGDRSDNPSQDWPTGLGWTPAVAGSQSGKNPFIIWWSPSTDEALYSSPPNNYWLSAYPYVPDGHNSMQFYGDSTGGGGSGYMVSPFEGTLSQMTAETLESGTIYSLSVFAGDQKGVPFAEEAAIRLYAGPFNGTNADLSAGLLAEKKISVAEGNAPPNGLYQDYTLTFDSSTLGISNPLFGQNLTIVLYGKLTNPAGSVLDFDNVRFSATALEVPEPTSLVLLGLGGATVLIRRCMGMRRIFHRIQRSDLGRDSYRFDSTLDSSVFGAPALVQAGSSRPSSPRPPLAVPTR